MLSNLNAIHTQAVSPIRIFPNVGGEKHLSLMSSWKANGWYSPGKWVYTKRKIGWAARQWHANVGERGTSHLQRQGWRWSCDFYMMLLWEPLSQTSGLLQCLSSESQLLRQLEIASHHPPHTGAKTEDSQSVVRQGMKPRTESKSPLEDLQFKLLCQRGWLEYHRLMSGVPVQEHAGC